MPDELVASDVEVRPSSIEGLGVFAARDFAPSERIRIVNVAREITDDAPLRPEDGERFEHLARPDGKIGTSFFTLPTDVQREYLPLLADWFVARYSTEVAALRRDAGK